MKKKAFGPGPNAFSVHYFILAFTTSINACMTGLIQRSLLQRKNEYMSTPISLMSILASVPSLICFCTVYSGKKEVPYPPSSILMIALVDPISIIGDSSIPCLLCVVGMIIGWAMTAINYDDIPEVQSNHHPAGLEQVDPEFSTAIDTVLTMQAEGHWPDSYTYWVTPKKTILFSEYREVYAEYSDSDINLDTGLCRNTMTRRGPRYYLKSITIGVCMQKPELRRSPHGI